MPEVIEEFMAYVTEAQTKSIVVKRRGKGMGSAGDELRLLHFTNLQMSDTETLLKIASVGGDST